jgi:hypothetical protein
MCLPVKCRFVKGITPKCVRLFFFKGGEKVAEGVDVMKRAGSFIRSKTSCHNGRLSFIYDVIPLVADEYVVYLVLYGEKSAVWSRFQVWRLVFDEEKISTTSNIKRNNVLKE